jgi:hypothetical protein
MDPVRSLNQWHTTPFHAYFECTFGVEASVMDGLID